jgi:hypothetical protein
VGGLRDGRVERRRLGGGDDSRAGVDDSHQLSLWLVALTS